MPKVHVWLLAALLASLAAAQNPAADTASARQFLAELNAGQWTAAEARFDANMKQAAPPEKLAAIWRSLGFQKELGPPESSPAPNGSTNVVLPCQFARRRLEVLVSFDAAGRIQGFFLRPWSAPAAAWKPPAYAHPARFHERPLTVTDGRWRLPGTLTIPNGSGPFPAVVLVAGSGPNDQDETVAAQKPFKDLAWGLASAGVVVLRYPKRTAVYGANSDAGTVTGEYLDDARAAVAELAAQREVDRRRVFLLGHSEGGYLAPRIAAGDPVIRGIVVMAGPSRSLEQVIADQNRTLAHATPAQMAQVEAVVRQIAAGPLRPNGAYLGLPGSYWLDLRGYRPAAVAAHLGIPILVVDGTRDAQVYGADFDGWKKALAGQRNVAFRLYPGLNHLFSPSPAPETSVRAVMADYARPEHVAPEVVSDIAAWIETGRLPPAPAAH